jgi:hypothetical protein
MRRFSPSSVASVSSVSSVTSVASLALLLSLAACGGESASAVAPGHKPTAAPPPNVVGGFSLKLPRVELEPGEERSLCYLAPLEIEGPSRIIGGGVLTIGEGMHHGNITTRERSGEGLRECDDVEEGVAALNALKGGAVLFGSSTQVSGDEWQTLPDGMGFRIPEGQEIAAQMHYINPTSERITVEPRYEWFAIDEAKVTQLVGPFAWRGAGFEIPPGSELTFTGGCRFPAPMKIVHALPHMHGLGVSFTASYLGGPRDGELFLRSEGYDPENGVMRTYEPAIDLGQGEGASFSCSWRNSYKKTIVEGLGGNEMCILFGYAYPPENAYSANASEGGCIHIAPPAPP